MNQTHNTLFLEGQRIILRPLRLSDAEEVYKNWAKDPEVAKYMRWNTHENVDVTREWLAQCESVVGKKAGSVCVSCNGTCCSFDGKR